MKISNTLYFDHQATTPLLVEENSKSLTNSFELGVLVANPHSSDHVLGWESFREVELASDRIAQLIGADPDEIIFTSGATESNNLALLGLAKAVLRRGDQRKKIIVSAIEHKCVLEIGRVLETQYGFELDVLPVDRNGLVSLKGLEQSLKDDVLLVSIMTVNNEIGTIQDIKGISKLVRSSGAIFHSDAAQAPLALDIQDMAQHIDLISLSGHKMYGPKGIGVLYIRRDLQDQIEPIIYGGGQQNGLRSGTVPTPLCVSMGAAAEFLTSVDATNLRVEMGIRRNRFVELLDQLNWSITLNGPPIDSRHPGNANIRFTDFDAHEILGVLQPHLAASTGSACTSGITEPSHVLKAIGLTTDEAEASIRFSLGLGTTDQDVEEAVTLIDKALHKLGHP